jgi:hypothetical protein
MDLNQGLITMSQKFKPQLYHNGFYYRLNNPSKTKTNWRCVERSCMGACVTYGDTIGSIYEVTTVNADHSHAPDPIRIKLLEKRRKIKEKGLMSDEAPRKILGSFENELTSDEEIACSASYSADRQALNRAKAKVKPVYPPFPESLRYVEFLANIIETMNRFCCTILALKIPIGSLCLPKQKI